MDIKRLVDGQLGIKRDYSKFIFVNQEKWHRDIRKAIIDGLTFKDVIKYVRKTK